MATKRTARRRQTLAQPVPVPALTLREKAQAVKRFAKSAYRVLSAQGSVSETALREEAYRMYAAEK